MEKKGKSRLGYSPGIASAIEWNILRIFAGTAALFDYVQVKSVIKYIYRLPLLRQMYV